ncbi:MAG: HlyD family type I secretion periplasmic adaptor subunit [Castellaniella sp.]
MSSLPISPRSSGQDLATVDAHGLSVIDDDGIDTNPRGPLRWGLAVLLLGFGGFILWAGLAPLDAGVVAEATVQVSGHRKVVQHLEGGIVDEILVREGDQVKAGQVLVRLDRTRAEAERDMVSSEYITYMTMQARLLAERDGLEAVAFDPALVERFGDDPRYQTAAAVQEKLHRTRVDALEGEIGILRDNLRGAEEQLAGLEKVRGNRQAQIGYIEKELKGVRELAREGYLPRNRMFELERDASQLRAALSSDQVEASRIRNAISELKLRIVQSRQDYQKEVESVLSDVQRNTASLYERLVALDDTVRRTSVRAPIDGMIQNVSIHTVGGVIGPGTPLMEVVPLEETFIVEAHVPVQSIDKVHAGLPVEIMFPAFNHAQTPNIPGEVKTLSGDRLTDELTRMPYYLARVEILPEGWPLLQNNAIRPGMPASVMIRTGERTLMSYLLKPFLDRVHKSFREQ